MKVATSDYSYDSATKRHTDTMMALGIQLNKKLCKTDNAKEHYHRDLLVTPRVRRSQRTDDRSTVAEQTMNTHFRQQYFIMINKWLHVWTQSFWKMQTTTLTLQQRSFSVVIRASWRLIVTLKRSTQMFKNNSCSFKICLFFVCHNLRVTSGGFE